MIDSPSFLGVNIKNRSVLASGILGVTVSSLKKVYNAGAGIVTTKSIGPEKRYGHKGPVIYDWGHGLINAVGLSNPGIDDFIDGYGNEDIDFPIIISIFGKTVDEFPLLAQRLEPLDFRFLEINISCPNVLDEFGTPFSFSPELTQKITRSVKDKINKPVIVKLSPNTPDIVKVARSAESSGADAICIVNTVGPGMIVDTGTGTPILANKMGGISGDAILPLTIKNIYDIYREVSIPIIGTGGVSDTDGALQVMMAGASLYGIGSAIYTKGLGIFKEIEDGVSEFLRLNDIQSSEEIVGLTHEEKKVNFFVTSRSFKNTIRKTNTTHFSTFPVQDILQNRDGSIKTLFFEQTGFPKPLPGQFYMLWKPGIDQKPYSVSFFNGSSIAFSLKRRGEFTASLFAAKQGDPVGLLGPLGKGFDLSRGAHYLLAGGGIGIAPLIFSAAELVKSDRKISMIAGGKTWDSISWINPLIERVFGRKSFDVFYCTEDGSFGDRGCITDVLPEIIDRVKPDFSLICGPEVFIHVCIPIFKEKGIPGEASIERMMKCGIGICGSCSIDDTGDRVCVEGPVFSFDYLENLKEFGNYKRDGSGTLMELD